MFSDFSWQDGVAVGVIVFCAYLLIMWVAALAWAYRDITSRTRDPILQAGALLTIFIFNLPGLFLYLILRPKETMAERYDRQLEAEALMQELQEQPACPSCRRRVEAEFLACPYCRAALRDPCPQCSRALAFGWVLCPYCGAARPQGASSAAPRLAAVADAPAPAAEAARQPERRPRPASTATFTPPARPQAGTSADAAGDPTA
jgi:hypothetical protein